MFYFFVVNVIIVTKLRYPKGKFSLTGFWCFELKVGTMMVVHGKTEPMGSRQFGLELDFWLPAEFSHLPNGFWYIDRFLGWSRSVQVCVCVRRGLCKWMTQIKTRPHKAIFIGKSRLVYPRLQVQIAAYHGERKKKSKTVLKTTTCGQTGMWVNIDFGKCCQKL